MVAKMSSISHENHIYGQLEHLLQQAGDEWLEVMLVMEFISGLEIGVEVYVYCSQKGEN